jgi:hypothetical protein
MNGSNRQSFIIRIWLERLDDEPDAIEWRGQITHVGTGDCRYVRDLRSVLAFISQRFDTNGGEGSATQVHIWRRLFRRLTRKRSTPAAE